MRYSIFKTLYGSFLSRKVTVSLIAFLSFFYFLGLVIPQQSLLAPEQFIVWKEHWPRLVAILTALRLTRIYTSPLVISLTILFFLNLLLVTVKRLPVVFKSTRLPASVSISGQSVQAMPFHQKVVRGEEEGLATAVRARLQTLGFRVIEGRNCFKAVQNRFSPIGSLLFHGSFLLMLLGGLFLFHTRFRGEAFVTEGQFFSGTRADYRSVSRLSEMRTSLPEIRFTVEAIRPRFEKMEPVSLAATITAEGSGVRRTGTLDVNRPFAIWTTSILITDVGVAPLVQVMDRNGNDLVGAFVALNVIRGDEDHFAIPGTGYDVWVKFWPDAASDATGSRYTRSYDVKNPLYEISVKRDGALVARGTLGDPSESIDFDGLKLSITGMRHFGRFVIVDERGGGLLIAGFIVALAGLTIKFLWPRSEYLAAWTEEDGKTVLFIGYHGEYLRGLGKHEFNRILPEVTSA